MQTLVQSRSSPSYDDDLVQWIDAQIHLLLENRFSELDIENLVEELDGMRTKELHALKNRLRVLIMHLLKCEFQKNHPQNKWHATLIEQRVRIHDLLADSPSLRRKLEEFARVNYPYARKVAALETHLPLNSFPAENSYSVEQILDDEFIP
ncbi:DUF29 family protein [Pseudoduganella sp. FT55W]|uniref:DUF29 family protein n=1 Tax=Duganella rivi TaxID=2666083 RepID=A0A7X4GRS9_9BURK|nr:DUF29 domain-containing protein [Duganella rivi]MYM67454.1 DUF29 family protein [Duganella rivi]